MTFTVQWNTSAGVVSVAYVTVRSAYRQAERVTKAGMKHVAIRLPDGKLVEMADFRRPFEVVQKD
ncbi:hypothetical protein [Methylorubrum extorquens]|jgi:hypothetical protein